MYLREKIRFVLEKFTSYIKNNSLCTVSDNILVAVSGGIDSVVLLDLFIKSGYSCAIAHCNFNLRGQESEGDQSFVEALAKSYEIPFYSKTFETLDYAGINKMSVQMAARDLRYEWFEDIRAENDFNFVATAHNKNDILETFFINLSRGTGIHGLTGIKNKNGSVIRPLLFASRQEIREYASLHFIEWHEDSSNITVKYNRNKIRHQVLPVFDKMNPKFADTMIENIQRLSEAEEIFNQAVEQKKVEIFEKEPGLVSLSIPLLKALVPLKTWLYELLKDYDFTPPVVSDITESLDGISGRQFFSATHRIIKDRNRLIISVIKNAQGKKFYIEDPYREISEPISLEMDVMPVTADLQFQKDKTIAYLDLDLLDFPLIIRKWEQGDYFQPFGMQHIKKLSDFFIDLKLSIPEKENVWLLTSGQEIIWIIGLRINDKFRVGPLTQKILKITYGFAGI